jgi:hypothetical protein
MSDQKVGMSVEECEHNQRVYAAYGRAMMNAQLLEEGLTFLVITCKVATKTAGGEEVTLELMEKLWEKNFGETLGGLIANFKKAVELPDDLEGRLTHALDTRNRLAHDFFKSETFEITTAAGRDKLIAEAKQASTEFSAVITEIQKVVQVLGDKFEGVVSDEEYNAMFGVVGITPKPRPKKGNAGI